MLVKFLTSCNVRRSKQVQLPGVGDECHTSEPHNAQTAALSAPWLKTVQLRRLPVILSPESDRACFAWSPLTRARRFRAIDEVAQG